MTVAVRITHEVLKGLSHLRWMPDQDLPGASLLEPRLSASVTRLRQAAAEAGLGAEDVDDITYAVVALIDEVVLGRGGTLRDEWYGRLLQLRYFDENTAGEGFFSRLELLRRAPGRTTALEVYYLCLLFGFRGRFAVRGMELQLADLTEAVRLELERRRSLALPELSPSGARREEGFVQRTGSRTLLWSSVGVLVLAVVLFVGLQVDLTLETERVIDAIAARGGAR